MAKIATPATPTPGISATLARSPLRGHGLPGVLLPRDLLQLPAQRLDLVLQRRHRRHVNLEQEEVGGREMMGTTKTELI